MKFLVTGAAGFIGSTLCARLLNAGHQVVGIDCFTDYYARTLKDANLSQLLIHPNFTLHAQDLAAIDLPPLLKQTHAVLHLAAQAGVRASWGSSFNHYTHSNITATQKLLEAMKGTNCRLVYASSSSVYGQALTLPTAESAPCHPLSPYGVTKLAAENLCWLYHANYGLPTVSLRFFTVYGPRQRPDMAFHRFIRAMLTGEEINVLGDGRQSRDFTFVDDIVEAVIAAALSPEAPGQTFNLGGGVRASIKEVIAILETALNTKARVAYNPIALGDVRDTFADTTLAQKALAFQPRRSLEQGLNLQLDWMKENSDLLQKA